MAAAGPFPAQPRIAVGLSGGPDSMVLTALARDWAAERQGMLTALTVDHGLRRESAAEAQTVAAWCADAEIAHEILAWQGEKPANGIQAAARDARYRLLADWCGRNGCTELLVGHTQNDQAETFLLRMNRGSGIAGLAAMPLVSFRDGLRLVRPLLTASRARVGVTATELALAPVTDPGAGEGNCDRSSAGLRRNRPVGAGVGGSRYCAWPDFDPDSRDRRTGLPAAARTAGPPYGSCAGGGRLSTAHPGQLRPRPSAGRHRRAAGISDDPPCVAGHCR